MKVSDHFTLEYLQGVPYLLPYGQAVADLRRGLQLNETGVFLWHALAEVPDFDALLEKTAVYYDANDSERAALAEDLRQFVNILRSYGILLAEDTLSAQEGTSLSSHTEAASKTHSACITDNPSARKDTSLSSHAEAASKTHFDCTTNTSVPTIVVPHDYPSCKVLHIGGLCIHFYGENADFSGEFSAFALQNTAERPLAEHHACTDSSSVQTTSANAFNTKTAPDLTIIVRHEALPKPVTGRPLLHSTDLTVYEEAQVYTLLFPSFVTIEGAALALDGSTVTFYGCTDNCAEDLFHAIRFVYLYLAQQRGLFAMHSVSILYKEKLWLFSGHSGMGKSTHAALWEQLYHTPIINGDLNLLSCAADGITVHGIPWCGTSGISDAHDYPLGGIFLLQRGQTDAVSALSKDKQQLLTMQRFISPSWTKPQFEANLAFAGELITHIPVIQLTCTKNESAATTCKGWIDAFLAS